MKNLVKLLSILQLTKEQPLSGYLPAGIKLNELPTLAEHQYNCVLMAYLILHKIKQAGGKINERKVILMLLIHDLSELFGGDVASPLNRKYPDLRQHKDYIGRRALDMLANFLDDITAKEFKALHNQFEHPDSDEAVVCKIIDQMDHQFFLEHHNHKARNHAGETDYRVRFVNEHVFKLAEKIQDPKTKKVMDDFLTEFKENYFFKGYKVMGLLMED